MRHSGRRARVCLSNRKMVNGARGSLDLRIGRSIVRRTQRLEDVSSIQSQLVHEEDAVVREAYLAQPG